MIHPYYERVYLACSGPTDLRKSIDGLAIIVKEAFELDPFSLHSLCSVIEIEIN
ncbi:MULTISPECIES: IS66 family insertion sequence element accessory protein TnpB [Paraliobacillus]|uniref:IS66 family insertion sequence element accessory protein TnpB n=1 Tax=Paraliobacillus sp. X-1268 TaxID=2213193 RepID=UPI000DD37F41